jgi:uncharacterized protein (TIGR03437 family)
MNITTKIPNACRVLSAALLLAGLTPSPAFPQTAAQLFDDVALQDVHLFVAPADWQKLRENYLLDTYYPARFVWNGMELDRVGIRSRGSGSRSPYKPNLLVAFNRYNSNQKLFGLATVVLKANNQDASLLREVLAMKLFRRMGLPAPLEAPARLYVNGEFFGAYTLVESIDEAFLARNFGEDSGYLYDWQESRDEGYRFEYLGPDPSAYVPAPWDPKTRKSAPDAAFIEAMVRAVNQVPDQDFVRVVSQYLDLKQFVVYLATENFLSDYDGFLGRVFGINNIYWYRFASGDPFVLIPWDKDGTFDWAGTPIFEGVEENVLARRALQVPELRQLYLASLMKAAEIAGGPGGWLEQELDRLYSQIREMAHADPHKQCSVAGTLVACAGEDFEGGIAHLREFVRLRAGYVIEELTAAGYDRSFPQRLPQVKSVVNAASNGNFVAPGSVITLYGEGLASTTAQAPATTGLTKLAGVVVTVNGARAPLFYVSPTQINALLPGNLTPGPVAIVVFADGLPGNTFLADATDYAPGIFLASHADGRLVNSEAPAHPGDAVVLYATGLGPFLAGSGTWATALLPEVTLGGQRVEVEMARRVPEIAGLYEVRFRVPWGIGSGPSLSLSLSIAGQTTAINLPVAQ